MPVCLSLTLLVEDWHVLSLSQRPSTVDRFPKSVWHFYDFDQLTDPSHITRSQIVDHLPPRQAPRSSTSLRLKSGEFNLALNSELEAVFIRTGCSGGLSCHSRRLLRIFMHFEALAEPNVESKLAKTENENKLEDLASMLGRAVLRSFSDVALGARSPAARFT